LKHKRKDSAGITFPPPLIFFIMLIMGGVIHWIFSVELMPFELKSRMFMAGPFFILAGLLAGCAFTTMLKAKTAINPNRTTTMIVCQGPFLFTRNPLYLALLMVYAGITVLINSVLMLVFWGVLFIIFDRLIVAREEVYLEKKFKEEYLDYKEKVRRWI
jgi:protein-S-isoprenylcysteine O-methyltransferase Ste14